MDHCLTYLDEIARDTIRFYDTFAEEWTADEPPDEINEVLIDTARQMAENPLLLNLGCGYGRQIEPLHQLSITRIIGVDLSERMIELARQIYPEVDFRVGDICNLKPIVPEVCDGFICMCTLMQVPRPRIDGAFASIRSVLRTGAIGLVSTPHGKETLVLDHTTNKHLPAGCRLLLHQWTLSALRPIVEKSGFEIIPPKLRACGMLHFTVRAI